MRDAPVVTRRRFVAASALGGLSTLVMHERLEGAPPAAAATAGREPAGERAPFPLEELSIAQLQRAMEDGTYTARALAQLYLERIAQLDRQGPSLRHVLETNPDVFAIADALDAERRRGKTRGALHGIPVLLKDNIDTADRLTTTAGSLALEGSVAARDAHLVERLRGAGAVILGKSNMSEWANFRSTHSSSGWSGRGGQGRNPYVLDRTPSGSSSGSGGATAASYCAAAVGTETDGSILSPAAACSLVGIKPTVGLVSRSGIIPIAHSQDTAGPMARTVADAAALLSVIAGRDQRDRTTLARRGGEGAEDYTRHLDPAGLRGARIGVARTRYTGYSAAADAAFERALDAMRQLGATLVDPADIATAGAFDAAEYEVLLYEFRTDLERYLATLAPGARVRTLADLIAFNRAHAAEEMPYFGQEIFEQAVRKGPLTDRAYRRALATSRSLSRSRGLDATLARHRLDAIVAPTQGPPALIDLVNGDPSGGSSTTPTAVAGYPAVTVPMGYVRGLPLGLTFMAGPWREGVLIRLAYAFEQATRHRVPPRFLPTAEV